MIKTWKHKGLKDFFFSENNRRINKKHLTRLKVILAQMEQAKTLAQMNMPGFNLHELKGKLKYYHSVTVQANWRVIFKFDGKHFYNVDYLDYH